MPYGGKIFDLSNFKYDTIDYTKYHRPNQRDTECNETLNTDESKKKIQMWRSSKEGVFNNALKRNELSAA